MIKTEEIRLHTLFIKFKNEGKGIDEIKGLLEVDGKVLENINKFKLFVYICLKLANNQ